MDLLALHLPFGKSGRIARPPQESEQSENPSLARRVLLLHFWLGQARIFWADHLAFLLSSFCFLLSAFFLLLSSFFLPPYGNFFLLKNLTTAIFLPPARPEKLLFNCIHSACRAPKIPPRRPRTDTIPLKIGMAEIEKNRADCFEIPAYPATSDHTAVFHFHSRQEYRPGLLTESSSVDWHFYSTNNLMGRRSLAKTWTIGPILLGFALFMAPGVSWGTLNMEGWQTGDSSAEKWGVLYNSFLNGYIPWKHDSLKTIFRNSARPCLMPDLSDCSSAYTLPWRRQINPSWILGHWFATIKNAVCIVCFLSFY